MLLVINFFFLRYMRMNIFIVYMFYIEKKKF